MKGGVINLAAKRDERDADRYRPWQAERLLEEFEAARGGQQPTPRNLPSS